MSDPEFATLAARFLTRVTAAIAAVRAALERNDHAELQRGLQNLSTASGMFGYQDISSLAQRADALCELRPLPMAIVTELLDAIDDARCVHIMSSASYGHERAETINDRARAAVGATSRPPAATPVQ